MNRILSGVQPTGNLHLGNYLGAIRNWVKLQSSYENLYMLADLHAITVPQDPAALRKAVRETAAAYIACGIDPARSAIFPQSSIAEHSELMWILSCHTPLGWLNRMTQFKEKTQTSKMGIENLVKNTKKVAKETVRVLEQLDKWRQAKDLAEAIPYLAKEETNRKYLKEDINILTGLVEVIFSDINKSADANLGLYSYPVLMAADILVYKATHVPVGEDQKQHLELCRDIAGAFNRNYKTEFFKLPEPVILKGGARIMSLRDGTKKMSKSDESDYSRINLTDDADAIAQKFKKAKSDMVEGDITIDEKRPEATNLLTIYAALRDITPEQAVKEVQGKNFSSFKQQLTDVAVAHLSPITQKMRDLLKDPAYIDSILAKGIGKARSIASVTMREVKDVVGFLEIAG